MGVGMGMEGVRLAYGWDVENCEFALEAGWSYVWQQYAGVA